MARTRRAVEQLRARITAADGDDDTASHAEAPPLRRSLEALLAALPVEGE